MTSPLSRRADGDAPELDTVRLGFIPLVDCATVVMAAELGFDRRYGIRIEPVRQASWSMVRDGLANGSLDASHALYGMVYGAHLGIGSAATPMSILMGLNHNGQGITIGKSLAEQGVRDGWSMARAVRDGAGLTLAHTFATGTHAMWLAYWLAAHGIDPARDVDRVVVPPPRMVAAVQEGLVHAFCVGEPWNTLAAQRNEGIIACTSQAIWPDHPEKVLAATDDWVTRHPNTARALVAALLDTARYLDTMRARDGVARRLAAADAIDQPYTLLADCLQGMSSDAQGRRWRDTHPLAFFNDGEVTYPFVSDGMWFLTQFVRWGLLRDVPDYEAVARAVHRIDVYQDAAAMAGVAVPASPWRSAVLLDGVTWDARHADTYLSQFAAAASTPASTSNEVTS